MPPAFFLLLLFVVVPIAEVATFIKVGDLIGLWPTIAGVVLTAIAGSVLIRIQGMGLLQTARRHMAAGEAPIFEVFSGICLLFAGALLLTPGFLTDTLGFLLLITPLRRLIYAQVAAKTSIQSFGVGTRMPPRGPGPGGRPDIIEGDFEELDESDDMPPRGGGWGPRP